MFARSQEGSNMTTVREPLLEAVAILDLRPTQITVGMREVKAKRKHWRAEGAREAEKFLGKHMIPVIRGPQPSGSSWTIAIGRTLLMRMVVAGLTVTCRSR